MSRASQLRSFIKDTVGTEIKTATVVNVHSGMVDVRVGGSAKLLRGIRVIGDTGGLRPGSTVVLHAVDDTFYAESAGVTPGTKRVTSHLSASGGGGGGMTPHPMSYHTDEAAWHAGLTGSSLHDPKGHNHITVGGELDAYVRVDDPDSITAQHTFAPTSAQAPFLLGENAQGQIVPGLNADQLDGYDAGDFAITGHTHAHNELTDVTASQHHNQIHTLTGSDHTASGLTEGHVIRATGASSFAWQQLQHSDLGGITSSDHHSQVHTLVGSDHTASGLTAGHVIRATGASSFAWQQLQHSDLGGITSSDHHAPVTAGAGISVSGQMVSVDLVDAWSGLEFSGNDLRVNLDAAYTWTGTHTFGSDIQANCDLDFVGPQSITTTSGNLTVAPAGDVVLNPSGGSVTTTATVGTDNFVSQTTGWQANYAGVVDFREIYADELNVLAFTADVYSALAGGIIITKSRAEVSRDFTIPNTSSSATLYVYDHEGLPNTAVFSAGDYVCLKVISHGGSLLFVGDVYGTVSSYSDEANGEQSWTFTTTTAGYSGGHTIYAGSMILCYGQVGSGSRGVWEVTVLDSSGAPYSQIQSWSSVTDGEPDGFVTHVRIGNLDGLSGVGLEYGLFAGSGLGTSDGYVLITDSQAVFHNTDLEVHDGSNVVFKIDASTPSYALGSSVPTGYGSGVGVWAGLDGGVYKWRVGNPSGNRVQWNGSSMTFVGNGGGITNINGANIQTGTVTATQIAANAVNTSELAAGAVTAAQIAANTITAGNIASGAINTDELAAGAVTATKIDVSQLSAISANMGTLTAGEIRMYSGTWDSNATGFRLNATEIAGQNDGTNQVVLSSSTGRLSAGGGAVVLGEDGLEVGLGTSYSSTVFSMSDGSNSLLRWYRSGGVEPSGVIAWIGPVASGNLTFLVENTPGGVSYQGGDFNIGARIGSSVYVEYFQVDTDGNVNVRDGALLVDVNDNVVISDSAWRIGGVAFDLDFTSASYNTKAECQAVGVRFSDSDTPFPNDLYVPISGTLAYSNGWYASISNDDEGPAILVPLCRSSNWEFEIKLNYTAPGNRLGYIEYGYITPTNRLGAYCMLLDGSSTAKNLRAYFWTNDGDDTFTRRYYSGGYLSQTNYTYRMRCQNGCIGIWDDYDNSWHWYTGKQSSSASFAPAYVFFQFHKRSGGYPQFGSYMKLQNLKLTYLA